MQLAPMTMVLILASLVPAAATAQDPGPTGPSADFEALRREYQAAEEAFRKYLREEYKEADAEGCRLYIPFSETPPAQFARRFLGFAEAHPDHPSAFDSLEHAIRGSYEYPDVRGRTLDLLRVSYVTEPEIERLVVPLIISHDGPTDDLVFEIIARNPDPEIRILAYKALIRRAEESIQFADRVRFDEAIRRDIEANEGGGSLEGVLERGDRAKAEIEDYTKVARDLHGPGRFPDLSIGSPAPEAAGRRLDGEEETLAEYRGKVVVLDFWATWCGPCREMIPHQRELVARLKDQPFALISISADQEKELLTDFLADEEMPWTHWWDGPDGGIIDAFDVYQYPTIFVLDGQGVIRAKDVRGEQLSDVVDALLGEDGSNPTK
ncbi:TlpA family protein disulfide reductase [Tautonia plasticadhaerens]|uniref:Thiol-disulfide oxidoreductase ResA n=1 Tax=Tautonia plasticadhaerens TaxID=2527974 RepID=A0A518HE91_9BACT|nr:TlpA disulfide reductase family protein [Tautonia plasticadhaerens]QDV39167.1 Thiol-disulfide oxidoreductase ResA [Tautonia plasticadhaerens]